MDSRTELTPDELIALAADLRAVGVAEFEYRGARVRFEAESAPAGPVTATQITTATMPTQTVYDRLFGGKPPAFPGGEG